ncbi:hypothetical protein Q3G72_006193 [Acer saccharum]|nr:hypothetical protein Q3G72_006193 [Acer saccharum]
MVCRDSETCAWIGLFSVRFFRREFEDWNVIATSDSEHVLLWCGVVPSKVDLFLWLLAKRRLLVGVLLPKFTGGMFGCQL